MTAMKVKTQFHKLIDEMDDISVLESFYEALSDYRQRKKKGDILDDLSSAQVDRLRRSMRQIHSGNLVSHSHVKKTLR